MDPICPRCRKSAYIAYGVVFPSHHFENFIVQRLLCNVCNILYVDFTRLKGLIREFCPEERIHCGLSKEVQKFIQEDKAYWRKRGYRIYAPRRKNGPSH